MTDRNLDNNAPIAPAAQDRRLEDLRTVVRYWEEECAAVACKLGAAQESVQELIDATRKLANEASGFLSMASVHDHGFTNIQVLANRIELARHALARAERKEGNKDGTE